jgi:diguanylate cyclase (GGDEF)-like protein
MFRFRKLSIKYKLTLVVVLTSMLGVMISLAGTIIYDREKQRQILSEEMEILTRVIASRSSAALSFNDQVRATENLSALLLRDSIVSACMYTSGGSLFARAVKPRGEETCEQRPPQTGHYFEGNYLTVAEPVMLNRQQIGSVVVRTDLNDLDQRLANQVVASLVILVLALFAAMLMTSRLQRMIYEPIVRLGEVAHKVTFDGNYSIRASTRNEDEIGETVSAFNAMLTRIEQDKRQLTSMAYYDTLTMLPNRRSFTEQLSTLLEELASSSRRHGRLGVIFVDLDYFKEVNDTLGHDVGDQFLEVCARRLEISMPDNGKAFRLAGDEFTILLTGVQSEDELENTAQQILRNFKEPFVWTGGELAMSASLGGALSEPGDDVPSLLKKADLAVYQAKHGGRGNYRFFTGEADR